MMRCTCLQVGPRMNFSSAWSTNAVSICKSCGLTAVTRMEVSRRFLLKFDKSVDAASIAAFAGLVHDRMTEQVYPEPLRSFASDVVPAPVTTVAVLQRGRAALEEINREMGLAFDEEDLSYYTRMFRDDLKRDPTNVELFDLAQSNSEHRCGCEACNDAVAGFGLRATCLVAALCIGWMRARAGGGWVGGWLCVHACMRFGAFTVFVLVGGGAQGK